MRDSDTTRRTRIGFDGAAAGKEDMMNRNHKDTPYRLIALCVIVISIAWFMLYIAGLSAVVEVLR